MFILAVGLAEAHEPITTKLTWTREISRIFYKRCVSCHHEGGSAMSLLTYDEARPWAKAIRDEVFERRMPPWGPVKGFGDFRNDASLSEPEMAMIANWVEGGAPKGEEIYLPSPPSFSVNSDPSPPSGKITVEGAMALAHDTSAIGVEPSGELRMVAHRPDGSIEPLIWIRSFRPTQPKAYYFREPVRLPKGTQIIAEGSNVVLLTSAETGKMSK